MREIKFRAWNIREKEMRLSPPEIQHLGSWFDAHLPWAIADVENIVIMQFIGLKDEKGQEVFEGDVVVNVHSEVDNNKYYVIHNLSEIHSDFCLRLPNTPCVFPFSSMRGIKVIGNIYENPELLS